MESEWIKRAKKGDIAAFERLIESHQTAVYNLALRILKNEADAADAAQEALIKVYQNLSKFEQKSKFSTWLYRITYHVCIDAIRKQGKAQMQSIDEVYDDSGDSKLVLIDTAPGPEQASLSSELGGVLSQAINSLPPEQRAAIMLRDADGLSYEEIATIQRCAVGTVKSRINRGRERLKEILADYLEQNDDTVRQNKTEGRRKP